MPAISVREIQKSYASVKALKPLSFEVDSGELFGLIGPDGAGKTTLIKILVTLLKPDQGDAAILNYNVLTDYQKIRQIIGYMPGKFALYQDLSIQENMEFFSRVFRSNINDQMDLIGEIYKQIAPFKNRLAGKLSGGMKQKLALCCALVHRPKVLILDEPTTGVDAVSRKEFWDMLQHVRTQGISILVSTPYMDEAALCDRVALMQEGAIIALNTPAAIRADFQHPIYALKSLNNYRLLEIVRKLPGSRSAYLAGECIHFVGDRPFLPADITDYVRQHGIADVFMEAIKPDVEDCFIDMTRYEK